MPLKTHFTEAFVLLPRLGRGHRHVPELPVTTMLRSWRSPSWNVGPVQYDQSLEVKERAKGQLWGVPPLFLSQVKQSETAMEVTLLF
jgi:hypothetical protein